MANVAPALTIPFTISGAAKVGQGNLPIIRCLVSFDAPAASTTLAPSWTDYTDRMRSYSIKRGRSSELSEFDTGACEIVFSNKDRALDPAANSSVRPMNRVWVYEEFSGEVQDLFHGYADSWQQNWDPSGVLDATATLTASDEFKILQLDNLPATNPPQANYGALVQYDSAESYYAMNDHSIEREQTDATIEGADWHYDWPPKFKHVSHKHRRPGRWPH